MSETVHTNERPAKRARTETPRSAAVNSEQEDAVASDPAEEAEDDQVFEVSKDPSRAADLYLDTVCILI
jgi:hypothetical protein